MAIPQEPSPLQLLEAPHPFVLPSTGAAHDFKVHSTRDGKIYCVLRISHALCDAASLSVIMDELVAALDGRPAKSQESCIKDVIALQQSPALQQAGAQYWESNLSGLKPCLFPTRACAADAADRYSMHSTSTLTLDRLADVRAFCRTHGTTPASLLQAAWSLALSRYTAKDDVCFGYFVSDRDHASVGGIESAAGPFINVLACRARLAPGGSLRALGDAIERDFVASLPHQSSCAPALSALSAQSHSSERLFNTVINYHRRRAGAVAPPEAGRETVRSPAVEYEGGHDPMEVCIRFLSLVQHVSVILLPSSLKHLWLLRMLSALMYRLPKMLLIAAASSAFPSATS
jgi:hypothetical protein